MMDSRAERLDKSSNSLESGGIGSRAAFEACVLQSVSYSGTEWSAKYTQRNAQGEYTLTEMRKSWLVWQAATERAAKVCDDRTPSVDDYSDQRDFAIRGALRDLAAAIRGS